MNEKAFTTQVIELAQRFGWMVLHLRPAQTAKGQWVTAVAGDGKGWPDLFMVRGTRAVAAELKVGRNTLTAEQEMWLDVLCHASIETYEWWPKHWAEIEEVLR